MKAALRCAFVALMLLCGVAIANAQQVGPWNPFIGHPPVITHATPVPPGQSWFGIFAGEAHATVTPTPRPGTTATPAANVQENNIEAIEAAAGRTMAVQVQYGTSYYFYNHQYVTDPRIIGDRIYNRMPLVSLPCDLPNSPTQSLATYSTGKWNKYLDGVVAFAQYFGEPVILSPMHEFNLATNEYKANNNGTPANGDSKYCFPSGDTLAQEQQLYVTWYQYVYNYIAPKAPNIIWTWRPSYGGTANPFTLSQLDGFIPTTTGTPYSGTETDVDYNAVDSYDFGGVNGYVNTFQAYYSHYDTSPIANGLGMMFVESGENSANVVNDSHCTGYTLGPKTQAQFFQDEANLTASTFPHVHLVSLFDSWSGYPGCNKDWDLDAGGLTNFIIASRNAEFAPMGYSTPIPPTPAAAATAPPLRDQMAWFGELSSEGVNSNMTATSAQIAQFDDLCIGSTANSNNLWATTCPGPGRWSFANGWEYYMESGLGQPNSSGHDADFPFHGSYVNNGSRTCDSAATISSGDFWAQQANVTLGGTPYTIPDYTSAGANNWFLYVNGGTVGNVDYMGWGIDGTSEYYLYLNPGSASLLAFTNDVIANCKHDTSSVTQPFDAISSVFKDNAVIGLESAGWDIWDRYEAGKNFGTGSSSPYADPTFGASGNSFNPTAFFNGSYHTRTTLLTSNDTPITFPTDPSYETALAAFLGGLQHQNGSAMNVTYNGFLNTDQTLNQNANTRFGVAEELIVGCDGVPCPTPQPLPYNGPVAQQIKSAIGTDLGMHSVIDNIAALYQETVKPAVNTQIAAMFLADQSDEIAGTSTASLGTGIHQQNQLWEYAPILGLYTDDAPDMIAEFSDMCGFGSVSLSPNCMDVWPFDFIMPSGRDTPMPADPSGSSGQQPCGEYAGSNYQGTNVQCAIGGSYDSNIKCSGISGMYCFEFEHLWAFDVTGSGSCTAFARSEWYACAQDIGPLLVVINGSGSSHVMNAAAITAYAPHTASRLGHILVPCTPLSTYWGSGAGAPIYAMPQSGSFGYGTAQVCNGSSGQDVPNGGTFDHSKALSDITSNSQVLYDGQVLLVVH